MVWWAGGGIADGGCLLGEGWEGSGEHLVSADCADLGFVSAAVGIGSVGDAGVEEDCCGGVEQPP